MKKKYIIVLTIIFVTVLAVIASVMFFTWWQQEQVRREDANELMRQQAQYGWTLGFTHNPHAMGWVLLHISHGRETEFTEIVFVHSAEEAEGFPEHVLAAWPRDVEGVFSYDAPTEVALLGFNWWIERINEIAPGEIRGIPVSEIIFPGTIQYPIGIEDLVDHWEDVMDVLNQIPSQFHEGFRTNGRWILRDQQDSVDVGG